jgi:spore coat polysaccharide biosynthesis protein SpsF
MKIGAIIQARDGGTRLPGKVLLPLAGKPALLHCAERVSRSYVDEIIVATTRSSKQIIKFCKENKINYYAGSENDVLKRVYKAATKFKLNIIIDITADCPLVDPGNIGYLISTREGNKYDYVSNAIIRQYPDGFDIQVYTYDILKITNKIVKDKTHRHHSGWNIYEYRNISKIYFFHEFVSDFFYHPDWGLTLDTKEDYILLDKIFKHFDDNRFTCREVIEYINDNPELLEINNKIKRKTPGEG